MTAPVGVPRKWEDLALGQRAEVALCVGEDDMRAFAELSGDRSTIHIDEAFARGVGFAGRVVYGGLIVGALSQLVGMRLPGPIGLATGWKIDFHSPLYIGEQAIMAAELTALSESTRLAKLKYTVVAGKRLVAKGTAEAKIMI